MRKTPSPKPVKKPKTPSRGREHSPRSGSPSSSSTTTPRPPAAKKYLLLDKDVGKIIDVLREHQDTKLETVETRLAECREGRRGLLEQVEELRDRMEKLEERVNEAAISLLQR